MDLFFVISGVVIAESTRGLPAALRSAFRFTAVRFARIFLGWWPFFALYLLSDVLVGQLAPEVSLFGSFFLLPISINKLLLGITWTLSFELYFYLMVGTLLVLSRARLRMALCIWGAAVLAFTLYSLARGLYKPEHFRDVTIAQGFFGAPIVLEFIAGFFLCDYLRKKPGTPWQPFALVALLLGGAATWYQIHGGLHASGLAGYFHGPERALLIGGACCGLVACALLLGESNHAVVRWAVRMGDASYAIYLSHLLVITMFYLLVVRVGIPANYKLRLFVPVVAAVVAYSWLHYRWIERPLYQAARGRIQAAFRYPQTKPANLIFPAD